MKIKPVFVDSTGKRRKVFTMMAAAAGVLLTTAVVILIAGFFGAGPSHLPGLPDLRPPQQEGARVPEGPPPSGQPGPVSSTISLQNGTNPAPSMSTSDTRGNRPTHTPGHPQPTKTK